MADEKAAIVAESYAGGETVCGVARRHGLTPQQLFKWRRLSRRELRADAESVFVPAVIQAAAVHPAPEPRRRRAKRRSGGIELEIDGVSVWVGAGASPKAIAAVIQP